MEAMNCWQPLPKHAMGWTVCSEGLKFYIMQGLKQGHPRSRAESQIPTPLLCQTLSPPLSQQPILPQRPGLPSERSSAPNQTSGAHDNFCWMQIAVGLRK
eukprot:1161973-Pelagomonas_calceolata.AAC.1